MTLSLNIGNLFNDSSSHALVDELRKRTSEEDILEFEKKFMFIFMHFSAGYILFVFEKYFLFNELLNVKFLRL